MKRLASLLLLIRALCADAEIYPLPSAGSDVIGELRITEATYEDTLIDIARRHGLGYHDITRANPELDVWLPGAGARVVLPARFVLPSGPRQGLVVNLAEYRLYYFPPPGPGETPRVMTYPMSIGRMDWETPLGMTRVVQKTRNPSWYPPESLHRERLDEGRPPLPRVVPPGPDNPLGSRSLRLAIPGYLIHGTNRPAGVGMRVTHGCIRMFPEDIEFLFEQIDIDTPVRIVNEPVKFGWNGDALIMEAHPMLAQSVATAVSTRGDDLNAAPAPGAGAQTRPRHPLTYAIERFVRATRQRRGKLDWERVEALVAAASGVPSPVGAADVNALEGDPVSARD